MIILQPNLLFDAYISVIKDEMIKQKQYIVELETHDLSNLLNMQYTLESRWYINSDRPLRDQAVWFMHPAMYNRIIEQYRQINDESLTDAFYPSNTSLFDIPMLIHGSFPPDKIWLVSQMALEVKININTISTRGIVLTSLRE